MIGHIEATQSERSPQALYEETVQIDRLETVVSLFGSCDENIRLLEKTCRVSRIVGHHEEIVLRAVRDRGHIIKVQKNRITFDEGLKVALAP